MTRALSQNRQKEIGGGLRELPHVRQMDRPTMETESAEPEYPRLGLKQVWLNELFGQAWSRSWTCKESSVPEWFPPALQFARPCLGYGVVDPIELRIDGSRLTSICVGSGRPLARYLSQSFVPEGESYVRFLIEQMCFGLMRVHEGQGAVHGGLTPFNVMVTDRYHLNLWSVPTARLELSYGEKSRKWELPYRSPQVREGSTPTIPDDIFSLGMLLARLLFGTYENFQRWLEDREETLGASGQVIELLKRCTHPEREQRFGSLREFVTELNPESELLGLDILGAQNDLQLGLEAFRQENFGRAEEHFSDALRKDSLGLVAHNNLAVARGVNRNWEGAREALDDAYKLQPHHPLLDTNFGLCVYHLGDEASAEFWLQRAVNLQPRLVQPKRVLARFSKERGQMEEALRLTRSCLLLEPSSRENRLLMASLLEIVGDVSEATVHKKKAESLAVSPNLFDHLITEETPPPWTLCLNGEDETVMRRFEQDTGKANFEFLLKPEQ